MLLSVITINLNNSAGLRKTANSICKQSFSSFEWIVIDGGSTDNSLEVINEYKQHISYWVSEKDNGIYDAMNKGIKACTGTYCIFMNSGDAFADESVVERVINHGFVSDIIAGHVCTKSGHVFFPPSEITFRHLYHQNIPHQAEFIKKDLFSRVGYYSVDLQILSDYEFNIKAAFQDATYEVVPILVAEVEEGGISDTQVDTLNREREKIFNRLLPARVIADYLYWLNPTTYGHPAVKWLISKPLLMKAIIKFG